MITAETDDAVGEDSEGEHDKGEHDQGEHDQGEYDKGGHATSSIAALTLGALGVVFGDIGTSPLYALKESFHIHHGRQLIVNEANVIGLLSLVFWALVIVISVKYIVFVMRADNEGEGGILALTALVRPDGTRARANAGWLVLFGLFGAALLYGDGMITPAISVLSALEGTEIVTDNVTPFILPTAIAILFVLFWFQKHGTAAVGKIFGPVMVLWFTTLGVLGLVHIFEDPAVFRAINPLNGVTFFVNNGMLGLFCLGSVVLVVTGGEALYADMGHFGRRPIKLAWYGLVLPGLMLNYFGQGAMLLADPTKIDNPFYRMAPEWAVWPMVILATLSTVIASQALISGAFSMTRQAVQLGYLPRVKITHTSESEEGQIYVPAINWMLCLACIALVVGFRTSSNLAAAYGLAVTVTMAMTTVLFYRVVRLRFGWSRVKALPVLGAILLIDLGFLGANVPKIPDGGWVPIVIGATFLLIFTTWNTGRSITGKRLAQQNRPLEEFVGTLGDPRIIRGPGLGVYMGSNPTVVPQSLSSHLRHASVLPTTVVVLAIKFENRPHVTGAERIEYDEFGHGVHR
ncbi:MAG: KUP/HAK/KT family potassium transporter, partial [Actinobacteria bacterium]|nr:KUP/HAK/KT family potassium transporter [Actinomycetota bacterium]